MIQVVISRCLFVCFVSAIFSSVCCFGLTVERVILATDSNPQFIEFWPLVAKAWTKMGIKPTLALIAETNVPIDTSVGDVIRFSPIPGVSTAMQAQTIRLLLPAYYPNDVCLVSDIDMYPLDKQYFINSAKNAPDNAFVIFKDKEYPTTMLQYPMCYLAAKGSIFKELFAVHTLDEIPSIIQSWSRLNLGWSTDELVLYQYVQRWIKQGRCCIKLGHKVERRLDRGDWENGIKKLGTIRYIDSHMPRPYSKYKKSIDKMAGTLKL